MRTITAGAICLLLMVLAAHRVTGSAGDAPDLREVDTFTASGKEGKLQGWSSADNGFNDLHHRR